MCRLIKCSWYYSWLTQIRSPHPISFFHLYLPLQSCCTQGGDLSQGQLTVINAISHRGPNNESPSLGFGLSIMHLWQFLESQWFGLAPVPSSVSFGCCFLHNVSWLDSLLSWGSSRKDSETSEWRCVSAVFPAVVKNTWQKQLKGGSSCLGSQLWGAQSIMEGTLGSQLVKVSSIHTQEQWEINSGT